MGIFDGTAEDEGRESVDLCRETGEEGEADHRRGKEEMGGGEEEAEATCQ